MSGTAVDGLVEDYLGRLERAAWSLPEERRQDLLEGIGEHIASARAGGADDEQGVRELLRRLGSPEEIVAEAVGEEPAAGARPASLAREGWAVGLMTGGSLLPFLGWVAGVGLMWSSARWTVREKLLGTLVLPFGAAGGWYLATFVHAARAECGPQTRSTLGSGRGVTQVCEAGSVDGALLTGAAAWLVVSVAVAVVLWRRAGSRRGVVSALGGGDAADSPWTGLEITAIVLLSAGNFLFPVAAPLAGLVLAICSRAWRLWEKVVAGLLCLPPWVLIAVFFSRAGDVPGLPTGNEVLLLGFVSVFVLSGVAALFLGLRLRGRS